MLSRNYNKMNNVYNINNCSGSNPFNCGDMLSSITSGCNSIFNYGNTYGNMYSGNMFSNSFGNIFGGGFNMFGNMFGNMFTNCNGTTNWDAMLGFSLGNLGLNFLGLGINALIQNKQQNSTKTIQADINGIQEEIDKKLENLGDNVDETSYTKYDVKTEDWYTEKKTELEKSILTDEKLIEYKGYITDYEAKEKAYLAAEPTDTNYTTLKNGYEKAKENKKIAEEKIAAHKKAKKDLDALEKKAETEQKVADNIIEAITDLIEKRTNAEAALDKQIANKVDGNKATRNKNFIASSVTEAGFKNFKKNDLKNLNFQFTHLDDGEDKFRYAEAIYKLDQSKFNDVTNGDENYAQVRKWAVDYYNANKDKYSK